MVLCFQGHFEEYLYDDKGNLIETLDTVLGVVIPNIEKGQRRIRNCSLSNLRMYPQPVRMLLFWKGILNLRQRLR